MVEYTIDDIRGPTVAREMAQLKEFVLAQFNGAIADAEAAAAAAATAAANAVIGSLTSRVTALEGDMTTAQGDIITNANAILALDGAVVKLAGAQTITGAKTVPLEATGTASNQIASSQKVKNELDNYAPMLRTSGNQTFTGKKLGSGSGVYHKLSALSTAAEPPSGSTTEELLALESSNGGNLMQLFNSETKDAQCILNLSTKHVFKDDDNAIKTTQATLWLVAYKDKAVLFLRGTDKNGTSTSQTLGTINF